MRCGTSSVLRQVHPHLHLLLQLHLRHLLHLLGAPLLVNVGAKVALPTAKIAAAAERTKMFLREGGSKYLVWYEDS